MSAIGQAVIDALARLRTERRQSSEEWLIDILSDLRHWARGANLDFDNAVHLSEGHFQCELDEEADEETDEQNHNKEGAEA